MPFTEGLCPNIQQKINNAWATMSPSTQRSKLGYLDALQSPQNTTGVEKIATNSRNGKTGIVTLTGYTRGVVAETSDDPSIFCDAAIEPTPYEIEVECDNWISLAGLTFNEDQMRKICDPDSMWIADILNSRFDAIATQLDAELLALQAANFGNFIDGTATVHTIYPLNSVLEAQPIAETLMLNEYMDINGTGTPLLVGAENINLYSQLVKIGCCNDGGVDVAANGQYQFFYDRQVGAAFGDNNDFVLMQPGAVQLVTWNRFVGPYIMDEKLWKKDTITDPKTGVTYDMVMSYSPCEGDAAEGQYVLSIGVYYTLAFLPVDAYQATDPLYGVNGTLYFNADCGDYTCSELPAGSEI
jgi:hypothetical protein